MAQLPYGYKYNEVGKIIVSMHEANVVKMIFERYLAGDSLNGISSMLSEKQIPTTSGKRTWSYSVLNRLLSNGAYVPYIISFELFTKVQFEKANRSNMDLDTGKRKAARYSTNVLSGLLICADCGAVYRRTTRNSGEVVWRCANRVEHGKEICMHSSSISEAAVKAFLCDALSMEEYAPQIVKENVESVLIGEDMSMTVHFRENVMIHHALKSMMYEKLTVSAIIFLNMILSRGYICRKLLQVIMSCMLLPETII